VVGGEGLMPGCRVGASNCRRYPTRSPVGSQHRHWQGTL